MTLLRADATGTQEALSLSGYRSLFCSVRLRKVKPMLGDEIVRYLGKLTVVMGLVVGVIPGSACLADSVQLTPKDGGVLRVAQSSDPLCLDPQQAGNNDSLNIGRQITDSLTDQRPDTGEIVPWLASRWTVSQDSRVFTFYLRPGVTFSDGTPVDAAAVKTNFEGILKLGARASLGSGYLAGLKEIQTPDRDTVVLTFSKPNVQFLQASSTMSLGLLSPGTLARDAGARCQGQLVGSGPFTVTSFVHNQRVVLTRREDYAWPSSLAGHQGKAYLSGIDYRIVPESGVRTGSLLSGQIDVDTGVLAQDERLFTAQALPVIARPNPGLVFSLFPNETDPVLGHKEVRLALNKAVNRQEIKNVISHYQSSASSALAGTTPFYTDHASELGFDLAGSKKILDDAGWRPGSDGIRERDGQRLVIHLSYWQSAPYLELLQEQLRAVGIDLVLNQTTISQTSALQNTGKYQVQFYNLTRSDPDILRAVFAVDAHNVNNRKAEPVDALLDASSAELDVERRRNLISQAVTLLIEEGHIIPLVEVTTVVATAKTVHGLHHEASSRLQFFDTWIGR
ncbi:ABC transporter substrate-binding protein [Acetobacter vaccinii]|nr:ABC transporter substrate-binding protein [Acetobacter vaccinii]